MQETVNITQALAIEGWMSEPELAWLAKQAVEHRCIVEIGSYLGRSTRALLDNTEGVVYACDDWKGPRDVSLGATERRHLFTHFMTNVSDHLYTGRLVIVKEDHSQIVFRRHADMVFIDGNHDYDDVRRDIGFWSSRLTPNGLLCGHDANFESVLQAVADELGEYEIAAGTNIWYRVRP